MLRLHSRHAWSVVAGLLALGLTLGPPVPSSAGLVPGGGKPTSDCYNEFDVEGVDGTANVIECDEGSACDADGLPNGVCDFKIALCPNQTDPNASACHPAPPLTDLKIKGKPKTLTLPPAPTDLTGTTCGDAADVLVPLKVTKKG